MLQLQLAGILFCSNSHHKCGTNYAKIVIQTAEQTANFTANLWCRGYAKCCSNKSTSMFRFTHQNEEVHPRHKSSGVRNKYVLVCFSHNRVPINYPIHRKRYFHFDCICSIRNEKEDSKLYRKISGGSVRNRRNLQDSTDAYVRFLVNSLKQILKYLENETKRVRNNQKKKRHLTSCPRATSTLCLN